MIPTLQIGALGRGRPVAAGGGGPSTAAASIAAKLAVWWTFDDTLTDSKSGLVLSSAAGGYSAAKKGNGINSVKAITGAGISGYEAAGVSLFGWIYPTTTASRVLCALSQNAPSGEILVFDYVSGAIGANYRNSAGYASGIPRIAAAINTWHFVVISWKPGATTTGQVEFSKDGATPISSTKNKGAETASTYFQLGSNYSSTVSGAVFDELGITLGGLTPEEIAYLYNEGVGKSYSEMVAEA